MKIKFSRHAKRRAKLYKIPGSAIEEVLDDSTLVAGKQEIFGDIPQLSSPVKIVVTVENDTVTVITNYPFKAGAKR